MDMQSGFWQIEVSPELKKTSFIAPDGLWQFKKMPLGLCNAPATFQRMMDIVLTGLKWKTCLFYLNDVVEFSISFDSHLSDLKDVLAAIGKAGLRLKISKCQFGVTTLQMLGHLVDQQGVRPNPEKVRAVQDFPRPKDVKSVQSFLGLCSYYRKFIPNFASIAKPLTHLTKSSTPFVWKEDEEASMLKLKKTLIEKTFLAHPDHSLPMEIHPDASSYGIGAVLIERIDGVEIFWHMPVDC